MVNVVQRQFKRGTVVEITAEVRSRLEVLSTPTSITVTVKDSLAATKVSAAAMTVDSTGKYYYACQTVSNWEVGAYDVTVTIVLDGYTTILEELDLFELVV